jgi:RpiB/LacA/LacB family sugar-phosphate isomerase
MKSRLYILPFDHRGSFKRILGVKDPLTKKDVRKIKDYKKMIYTAFKKAKINKDYAGILVDETYGAEILLDAKKKGIITCYTLEKSGQKEFFFDRKDYRKRLNYFKPSYAKVLLRYNPAGNRAMNNRQAKKLVGLSRYLKKEKIGFLLEVLEIPTEKQLKQYKSKTSFDHKIRTKLMIKAISELQKAGVNPDIWKLEGLHKKELMENVAQQVISFNPQARIVVLGRGENAKKAEQWVKEGAKVEAVIGFAVGRTVFKQPLLDYQNKKLNKSQTIKKITNNYLHFVSVFEKEKMKMEKKIYIGSDHAGFKLKEQIKVWLKRKKIAYQDLGNHVLDVTDDYPDFADRVARKVVKEKTLGILLCGSAEGVCIAANKIKGARAVTPFSLKAARLAREHNDANIICLSGWFEHFYKTTKMLEAFLETPFSGGERHLRRLNKIRKIENK